jgi:hypothetical protein
MGRSIRLVVRSLEYKGNIQVSRYFFQTGGNEHRHFIIFNHTWSGDENKGRPPANFKIRNFNPVHP